MAAGEFPGAVAIFGTVDAVSAPIAVGVRSIGGAPTTPDTVYDLASLTKVVSTLPSLIQLIARGRLKLDDLVRDHVSNAGWFQTPTLASTTIAELLTHTSGLPAWEPIYALTSDRSTALARVFQTPVRAHSLTGAEVVYSDIGFIILGAIIERITRERQDVFVQREVFTPLGMNHTRYGPVAGPVAPTEDCGWRNRMMEGTVHDENAYRLDGVAGHAGLFGTAADLARYAHAWLTLDPRLGPADLLASTTRPQAEGPGLRRGHGWLLKGADSFAGEGATEQGYGHTGFTGTSLWIDPGAGWYAVLLTNRVHPNRRCGPRMHAVRRAFHGAVAAAIANAPAEPISSTG